MMGGFTVDKGFIALLAFMAAFVLQDFLAPLLRRRMERAEDADRRVFTEILERVDQNQQTLADRLREDREHATKQFTELFGRVRCVEEFKVKIEAFHETNHPGQTL